MGRRSASIFVLVPPPAAFAAAFLVGIGLNRIAPLDFWAMRTGAVKGLGWALIAVGVVLGPVSAGRFVFRRTTLRPHGSASALVTDGAYAWTRNPMYAGLAAIYLGVALVLGAVWPLPLIAAPLFILNSFVIPFEEGRMRALFGSAYEAYCARVRRWL